MTNMTDLFNPPASKNLSDKEIEDCTVCQTMATVTALAAGAYFASGQVFKNEKPGTNPMWWKNFIKGTGMGLIGYGIYRGGDHWLWNKKPADKQKLEE